VIGKGIVEYRNPFAAYRGIRVALLGASGFIGRWVARALCAQGARTLLVVRDRSSAESIFACYGIRGSIAEVDLKDSKAVREVLQAAAPSITFNLAGYGIDRTECDAETTYLINAHLVETICQSVAEIGHTAWDGQSVVHVGSALEYGTIGGNLSEDSVPNPTTLYGRSKLAGTEALARFCKAHGLKGLTARLFTVYGPGEHPGRLLPALLEATRTGQSVQLTSGAQRRDFTYVEDVAEGLLRLGLAQAQSGEIVNLATGRLTPARDFAEAGARILGIPREKLEFGVLRTRHEEMEHTEPTVDRLWRLLAWVPPTDIDEGIRRTSAFMKAQWEQAGAGSTCPSPPGPTGSEETKEGGAL
jgi:UDP-glucose 4-epimerase